MESIGQRFKAAREKKRISLSQAALKTHMKVQNLEAMERDDFSKMPAATYARGFIRIYAGFLGLDPVPLLHEYSEKHGGGPKRTSLPADVTFVSAAPGDVPLPVPEKPVDPSVTQDPGNHNPSALTAEIFTSRNITIASCAIGLILIVVLAAKFWPSAPAESHDSGARVVEVPHPAGHSPLATLRDPPEPYIETGGAQARTP